LCSYTYRNLKNKIHKEKIWFEYWVKEGYSVRQLCHQSKHGRFKLQKIIQDCLDDPPETETDLSDLKHMIFDGTFIHGRKGIVAIMDGARHEVRAGEYGIQENSIPQLTSFFLPLLRSGLCPKSATVDGNPQVIRFFRAIWPHITIQRCLVHIQRQGLMWCRRFPKRTDAKHLRKLFRKVTYIRTTEEKDRFFSDFKKWENRFGKTIEEGKENGWVFSDIKRARSMLLKALPDMFHYLDDQQIPFSTNGLEGYFSRLKSNYRQHRGLSPKRRKNYFKWYFYLKNR
jgi:hypothetical protein